MYKCELCGIQSEPRQKAHKKILATKWVTHVDHYIDRDTGRLKTTTTNGSQIVKEVTCCLNCAKKE